MNETNLTEERRPQRVSVARADTAWRGWAVALACAAVLAGCGGGSQDLGTTATVGGTVDKPGIYPLSNYTPVVQSVTFNAGSTPQSHVYTGANLFDVLNSAGVQINAAVKNDLLNKYVIATGSDGYRVVYGLGEISPDFGNRAALLAYAETLNGSTSALTTDGPVRTTAPGDIRGGRYVSNLARVDVKASDSTLAGTGGGATTQFSVGGPIALRPGSFDLAALQALPSTSVTIGANTYTGVSLWTLLNTTVGLKTRSDIKNDSLGMYVVATGSDGYKALVALGELDTNFGNQPDLIAYSQNGAPITTNGFARLVVPNDVKAGRWVSNLIGLEIFRAAGAPP